MCGCREGDRAGNAFGERASGEPDSHGWLGRGCGRGPGNDRSGARTSGRARHTAGQRGSRGDALQRHHGGGPDGAKDRRRHAAGRDADAAAGLPAVGPLLAGREGAPRPGVATSRAAATATTLSNFNGTSSRDSQFTNYNLSSNRPTRGCARATGSFSNRSTPRTASSARTGSRSAGRSTSTTCSTWAARSSPATRAAGTTPATTTWFATILFLNDTAPPRHAADRRPARQRPARAVERVLDRHDRPGRAAAARASVTSRGSASTSRTCTSPRTSSRSRGRSSTAGRCG